MMAETASATPGAGSVETPSGKGAAGENFPVGSWLLRPRLRPHVAVFYTYARAIDDIADNPVLPPEEKIARLDGFARGVTGSTVNEPGYEKASAMRRSLLATGVTADHCCDLVDAFKQDAVKSRYRDWGELMGYCDRSAAPVGRYLIDLHGESKDAYAASDALCNALQVLNHLQDCGDDYRTLHRVYLPQDWMAAAGAHVEELAGTRAGPALRRVLDRCLGETGALVDAARSLPSGLVDRRFAMEAASIVGIARRLAALLAEEDPLAGRVALSRWQFAACGIRGALEGLLVARSRTKAARSVR